MDCVIIGGGVAGMQAALTVRRKWPEKTVTLIDTEQEVGYYRTLLPQFMNRTLPEKKLFFWQAQDDRQLRIISGVSVESIDRRNRALFLSDRSTVHYQRLLVASGGRPIVPGVFHRADGAGIFPVRSLTVARAARTWLPDNPEVVIVGGGLVGVKTAAHLAGFGFSVTLIEKEKQLLPHALSAEAARLVETQLRQKDIRLLLGSTVEDLRFTKGKINGVQANGTWLFCQTLFVAAGSVPEVTFLQDSDLLLGGRLEVTTSLQTRDEHIFAAGDAVTIVSSDLHTPWTWPQAMVQGRLAAANLCSPVASSLRCLSRVNAMNLGGLSLAVLGIPVAGARRSVFSRPDAGVFRELYHVDGRIVGGALVGDISQAGMLHAALNSGKRIEGDFDELLKPRIDSFAKSSPSCTRNYRRAAVLPSQGD